MIGRDADLQALRDELARAATEPRAIAIGGEAGIGKTRLITEFAGETQLDGSTMVLIGRCLDLGFEKAPYTPFVAILRELTARVGLDALLEAAGPARSVLTAILPELQTDDDPPPRTGAERLYELIAVLFENVAREHPLVLVIEDAHWADGATLDLLRFLVRMLVGGGILLLITYRSDELTRGHPLRAALPELERTRRLTRWELGRLTRDQVAAQAAALEDLPADPSLVDELFERSEGVPFFVEELVGVDTERLRTGRLPDTLRELLLARYDRLDDDTQSLLRLLAVGGTDVRHELLELIRPGSPDELDAAVRAAVDAGLLLVDDADYSFRHALVRTAIEGEVLPGERVRYHVRYAEAFEQLAAHGEPAAAGIAQHRLAAHDPLRAFPATIQAMQEARDAFAFGRVGRLGEQALELWEQVPDAQALAGMTHIALLQRTAEAKRGAGEGERSLALIDEALAECPAADAELRAELLGDKAQYLASLGRPGSTALLEDALDLLGPDSDSAVCTQLLSDLAGRLMLEARYPEAVDIATQALARAEAVDSLSRRSVAHNIRGVSQVNQGHVEEGLADLERARELAASRDGAMLRYRVNASDVMQLIGRYETAVAIGEAGAERARQLGVQRTSGVILASNTIEPLTALGRWDDAERLLEAAMALDAPPGFRVHLQRMRLWLLTWRGDIEAADESFRVWAPAIRIQSEVEMQNQLGFARVEAELALALERPADAWRAAAVLLGEHRIMSGYDLPLLADAARALAQLRDDVVGDDALSVAESKRAERALREVLAKSAGWPTAPVWIPLFEAELSPAEPARSGHGGTVVAWQAAVDAAALPEAPAHLAPYTLYRLAQAQVAAGDRAAAGRSAAEARQRASELGSRLLLRWLDDFARRAGVEATSSPRAAARTADAAPLLTERETQVLELIGQGLTNRQIGERLYISAKTASVHVSAILRKLGATSRTEAVYLARRDQVVR